MSIEENTSMLIFSDGITEAENPVGEMYSEQRLLDLIATPDKDDDVFLKIQKN